MERSRRKELLRIYKKLYAFFGPQKWWPGDTPFEVMVGAILTQNTSWANVEKAIGNLKSRRLLFARALYRLPPRSLAKYIRPAGYYNVKAKRLRNFLKFLISGYGSDIKKLSAAPVSRLREELLSVNGIGEETADSILLYALNKPVFVVDAYTLRIMSRHGLVGEDADYREVQELFTRSLKDGLSLNNNGGIIGGKTAGLFNEFHALLVRLGKDFCSKSKPKCDLCPLGDLSRSPRHAKA